MIKTILFGLLILININVYSQSFNDEIIRDKQAIGKNFITQNEIEAIEYTFPERIHDTYIDTLTKKITLQLRGVRNGNLNFKGKIVLYDLNNHEVKWTKKINYKTSSLHQFGKSIILTVANKNNFLNIENGNVYRTITHDLYFVDHIDNIGIGYKYNSAISSSNKLEGIDLLSGSVIWEREINREYGWNDLFYVNDSTLLIMAAGLHTVNIKKGTGWDFNTKTGEKDYSETAAANVAGAALGVLTGTFVVSTGYNLVRDVISNVIIDSTAIYFASKEKLSKINKSTGKEIWSYSFAENLPSKSSIYIKDSNIYIVNKGFAYMGYRKLDFGIPFIAAFNKINGERKFMSTIHTKKDPINAYKIIGDTISLVFKNKILNYSLENGAYLSNIEFKEEEFGSLRYFIGKQVYIRKNDSTFTCLTLSDTTLNYLFTSKGKTLTLNHKYKILDQIDHDELYINYLKTPRYNFIAKDDTTYIIDQNSKIVAEMKATSKATLIGAKLYDIHKQKFSEIDLKEFFENH